jgi:hypothetical protein
MTDKTKGENYGKWLMGRPLKFTDPTDLQEKINQYFDSCDTDRISVPSRQLTKEGQPAYVKHARPYTVEGLAEFLGTDKRTLNNYEKADPSPDNENREGMEPKITDEDKAAMSQIITAAKQRITRHKIERALIGAYDPRFAMFDLINNSDYKNEKAIDHTTKGEPITKIIIE